MKLFSKVLVDLGGTNFRVYYQERNSSELRLLAHEPTPKNSYNLGARLLELFSHYVLQPDIVGFGVAGPTDGTKVKFTNSSLEFFTNRLEATLKTKAFMVNDLAAASAGVASLREEQVIFLYNPGSQTPAELLNMMTNKVVVMPGTGLGCGYLLSGIVFPSEEGHAPVSEDPRLERVLRHIRSQTRAEVVSYEDLLRGPHLKYWDYVHTGRTRSTEEIVSHALLKSDELSSSAEMLGSYFRALGQFLGNRTLGAGAPKVVCLGGRFLGTLLEGYSSEKTEGENHPVQWFVQNLLSDYVRVGIPAIPEKTPIILLNSVNADGVDELPFLGLAAIADGHV